MSSNSSHNLPALLGGHPVFPEGPPEWPIQDEDVLKKIQEAFQEGDWGKYHGKFCEQLKSDLADSLKSEFVTLCSSGTVAVELALRGLKIEPGDEVILSAYDFDGNYRNIILIGARPVLVDVSSDNWNMDLNELGKAISPKTKGIIVSHLHGGVIPMRELMELAKEKGIPVIEDACQMPGAMIQGRPAGTWGDVGVFSFGGSKTLTAGRGGALFTNQAEIHQRVLLYQNRGNEAYPLSELQAAVLVPQLEKLAGRNQTRLENIRFLANGLKTIEGMKLFQNSTRDECTQPGYYKTGFRYNPEAFSGLTREEFCQAMQAEGIALHEGFRSFHCIHSSKRYSSIGDLKEATEADQNCIILHHPVLLESKTEMDKIISAIEKTQKHSDQIKQSFLNSSN